MVEVFSVILTLILISKFIEDKIKLPFVLIVIVLSYLANYLFDLDMLGENFEEVIYLMLPIILIPDVLGLSRSELSDNGWDIFYLAFTAVIISIFLAVVITLYFDTTYNFSIFDLLIVFTPLMATDVVSVGAIFSKFKLPQKLKLYAEGESLFNDITAMLIFFFIAIPILQGEDVSIQTLFNITTYTISTSIVIGLFIGLVGYYSFKISKNNFEEFISIYVMASLAFLMAEKIHLSGILSVVIAILFFKYLFDKEGYYKEKSYTAILKYFNTQSSSDSSFRAYKKEAYYLGLFANAVIFISIANVIDLELLFKYKVEILYTFVLTTFIRYFVVFILIKYRKLSLVWNNILTLSGMKGGLALIMIVSLSDDFAYKEMFMAVVLGVVILSIFIYTIFLMTYLHFEKDILILDKAHEHKLDFKNIKELLEKEADTGAYNEIVFEDMIEKEIDRSQRYGYPFSLVTFKIDKKTAQKVHKKYIRKSDYFGKVDAGTYAVLLTHNDINGALIFTNKIKPIIKHIHIGISQYTTGDSVEMMMEKLHTAQENKKKIDIEV